MRQGLAMRRCVALLVLAGCAGGASPEPTPTATDLDVSSLPACAEQPAPPSLPGVPGLKLPETATVFSVYEVGPLTQVEGIVEMTPVQVRAHYEQRDDLQVILVEDERVESEILVTDGTYRMFVKAQISCAIGSNFTATVGTEAEAGALPTPAGSPAPPN